MTGFLSIILLLGFVQGVILSFVLFKSKVNRIPNSWLSTALFVMSIAILFAYFDASGFTSKHVHLIELESPLSLIFMPLLYFYVRKLTQPQFMLKKTISYYFIPALLFIIVRLPFYFQNEADKAGYIERIVNKGEISFFEYSLLLFTDIHSFIYAFLILMLTVQYRQKIVNIFSDIEKIKLQWLKFLSVSLTLLAAISVIVTVVRLFDLKPYDFLNYVTGSGAVIMIYIMSYFALAQPEITNTSLLLTITSVKQENKEINYDDFYNRIITRLENSLLYKQAGLTLEEFSKEVKLPPYLISKVINKVGDENFYQLINRYRINAIKSSLEDPGNTEKIMTIARENGYLSKTTFNSVFKQFTNTTPSEYRKRYLDNNKKVQLSK